MSADKIVDAAVKQSGVSGFENGSFREGLGMLADNLHKGHGTPQGVATIERMMAMRWLAVPG